jgi:hypothetical protein
MTVLSRSPGRRIGLAGRLFADGKAAVRALLGAVAPTTNIVVQDVMKSAIAFDLR